MIFRVLSIIWVASVLGAVPALVQEAPPQEPILRIDPGMHTGVVKRIGVDAACKLLATASEDKTVRLWRLPDGKLLRVLRPPLRTGHHGTGYAVAVAPHGGWVAVGIDARNTGLGGDAVYIFRTFSGEIVARLGPVSGAINHLALSLDGRYLAATLQHGGGLRVWDTQSWRQIAEDKEYGTANSYSAAFDRAGVLFTVAFDGKLRRYAPGYRAKPTWVETRGGKPLSVAVHPSGDRVGVSYADTTAVEIYDGATLAFRFATDTSGVTNGNLGTVAWSADGARLYAGGLFENLGKFPILVWDRAGRGPARKLDGPRDTIMQLLPCGNSIALGSAEPAFGIIDANDGRRLWRESVQPQLHYPDGQGQGGFISADGRRVRFSLDQEGKDPTLFDLTVEQISASPNLPSDLTEPDTTSLQVTDWLDEFSPKLAGRPIVLGNFERSRSLAIASDKQRFVLGTERFLRGYNLDGTELWPRQDAPGVVWGVNISRDDRLVVAAYGDGTIRWHRLTDGQELLALFIHKIDRRWVAWTPKGYFTASAGGEQLIGWHVNRGLDKAADFFPVSKFRDQFYRPDVVARILTDLDEEKAISEANSIAKKTRHDEDIRTRQPPVLRILSPADGSVTGTGDVKIEYSLRSPSGLPIKRVFAQVDGNLVEGEGAGPPVVQGAEETKGTITVKLPLRNITVSITAETDRAFDTQSIRLIRGSTAVADPLPNLYAVVIGVAKYAKLPELTFANDDALAVADLLTRQKDATYATVRIKLFTTRENRGSAHEETIATITNVGKGLNWLQAMRKDVDGRVLVYFSGHGHTKTDGSSYLLPADFDPEDYWTTAISKRHLLDVLTRRGKVFLFIDACHAAGGLADVARPLNSNDFVNDATAVSGSWVFAFASSLGTQPSYGTAESKSFFTKVLVQGLRGAAAPGKKVILTGHLDTYLYENVKDESSGEQTAVSFKSPVATHVPVAILPP